MNRAKRTVIFVNRFSGGIERTDKDAEEIRSAFAAAGVSARIKLIEGREIAERVRRASGQDNDIIVIGGGDGSVSAAAGVLAGKKCRLAILPLGTLNHFARDLGIPPKIEDAAALIAKGKTRRVDVAAVNGRTFINNSAIGLYPLMVIDRDLQRKRRARSKRLAMVIAAVRTLARFGHYRLALTINERESRVDTPLLFVGNNDYRLDIGAPGQRDSLEDGKLSVFVMRKKTRRGFIAASIRALFNRIRPDDMVQVDDVQRLLVGSQRSLLAVSLDGEIVRLEPPLDYTIRRRALNVIAP